MSRPRNMIFEPAPRSPDRAMPRPPPELATLLELEITAELLPWFNSNSNVLNSCTRLKGLFCRNLGLRQLPNLPPTLEELYCNNNELFRLPLLPASLTHLYCDHNRLVSLPEFPENLEEIYCDNNALSSLPDLPDTVIGIRCNDNALYVLPEDLPLGLTYLICSNNQLTTLPALPDGLIVLECENNPIALMPQVVNMDGEFNDIEDPRLPEGLQHLNCSYNMLSELPPLPPYLHMFNCSGNELTAFVGQFPENLYDLNCSHNRLTVLPTLPSSIRIFNCLDNPLRQEPQANINGRLVTVSREFANLPLPPAASVSRPIETINASDDRDEEWDLDEDEDGDEVPDYTTLLQTLYANLAAVPLAASTITIAPTDIGYDAIMMGDENVADYLRESADNIVFKYANAFFFHTKSAIIQHTITDPNVIKYGCLAVGYTIIPRRENVNMDIPYVTGRGLGMTIGLIPLTQLKTLLTTATIQAVEVVATRQQLPSTASFQMLQPNPDAVSASHCQEGQGELVYELRVIDATPTSRGGRRRKRNRQTYRRRRCGSKKGVRKSYRR